MVVGSPIVLNLIPGGVMPVMMINETDKAYKKEFLIYNGAAPYNLPANVSATIRGTKRDGYGVTEAAEVTSGSNLVRITVTEQMTAVPGPNIFELVFEDTNNLKVATINFIMMVERSALNSDTVISDSDIAYAVQVLDRLQSVEAFKNQLDNASTNIDLLLLTKTFVTMDFPRSFASAADMYSYAYNNNMPVLIDRDVVYSGVLSMSADTYSFNGGTITAERIVASGDCHVIEGVGLKSNAQTGSQDETMLLQIVGMNIKIHDCEFEFTTDNPKALAIKGSSSRITVENCIFKKCATNFTGCIFVTIDKCLFDMGYVNTNHECIQFTAKTPGIISNNYFKDSENDFIDLYSAGWDTVVIGNTFDSSHSTKMIEIKTTINGDDTGSSDVLGWCRRIIISNNHFKNLIATSGGIHSFITVVAVRNADITDNLSYYPGDVVISDNIMEGCSTDQTGGVYFYGITCCAKNVIIKSNVITIDEPLSTGRSACIFVGQYGADPEATFWRSTESIIIDSNVFGGNAYAVCLRYCKDVIVSNNNGKTGHGLKRFVSIDGTITNISFSGNICYKGENAFSFLYANGIVAGLILDKNITDSASSFTGTLTDVEISGNMLKGTAFMIGVSTSTVTRLKISGNVFESTSYGIYSNGNTFNNCMISDNIQPSGMLIRLLNPATQTNPVMLGNVVGNAENNNIRTT